MLHRVTVDVETAGARDAVIVAVIDVLRDTHQPAVLRVERARPDEDPSPNGDHP